MNILDVYLLATMANNEQPQIPQEMLPGQSYTANAKRPPGGVRQDKGVLTNARIASLQPAPQKNMARPHQVNSNSSRSQNRPNPKRKTVHLTLWVKPVVKAELKRVAENEGISLSATGGSFLERAMQANVDMQYGTLLKPIIEQEIRKQMRSYSTRLAVLLVRVAFASEQTRSLVTNILGRQAGVNQPVLEEILNGSSNTAKRNITRLTPQLSELVKEIEKWMEKEGEQTNA